MTKPFTQIDIEPLTKRSTLTQSLYPHVKFLFICMLIPTSALAGSRIDFPPLPSPNQYNRGIELSRYAYQPNPREDYLQTWNLYLSGENGYQIFANFVVSNIGIGDNACGLNIAIVSPEGESLVQTKQVGGKEFNGIPNTLQMKCAKSVLKGDSQTISFSGEYSSLGMELVLSREGPGLDLDPMVLNNDPKEFVHFNMPHVTSFGVGRIKWKGRWIPISGRAILVHIHQTVGIHKYSLRWDQIRALTPDTSLLLGGFTATEEYGDGTLVFVLAKRGKIVHVTRDVTMESSDFHLHPKSGYSIPHSFKIEAGDSGISLRGLAKSRRTIAQFDVLGHVSWFLRMLVRTFVTNPWIFRNDIDLDLRYQLPGQTPQRLQVPGIHEAVFLND